jgi:hypothetical protein
VPWIQDLVDQARERQTQLDTFRQQRVAAAGPATPEGPVASAAQDPRPALDVQALIQQAVQQALAAQAAANREQPPAPSPPPDTPSPTSQDGWCARHQVVMERRSNAKGAWWSHWVADEEHWCRGK